MPAMKFTSGDNFFAFIRSEFQGAYLLQQIQLVFGVNILIDSLFIACVCVMAPKSCQSSLPLYIT
jgi:hypothetical protein